MDAKDIETMLLDLIDAGNYESQLIAARDLSIAIAEALAKINSTPDKGPPIENDTMSDAETASATPPTMPVRVHGLMTAYGQPIFSTEAFVTGKSWEYVRIDAVPVSDAGLRERVEAVLIAAESAGAYYTVNLIRAALAQGAKP